MQDREDYNFIVFPLKGLQNAKLSHLRGDWH